MLRLDGVHVRQGDFDLHADFTVPTGARVAVIGPSGGGKSTLLNALAGFLPLTSGRILWADTDITGAPPAARPIAMLFQDNNLFPHLSVAQNVGLGIRPDLRLTADHRESVASALARVGLRDMGARLPAQLSGGQQGRAALARALVQRKPLILLDEPFAALGPALKSEMLDLLADLLDETGATLLMVSHAPEDARRICPLTIVVDANRAAPPTDTGALLDDPPAGLRDYLGG